MALPFDIPLPAFIIAAVVLGYIIYTTVLQTSKKSKKTKSNDASLAQLELQQQKNPTATATSTNNKNATSANDGAKDVQYLLNNLHPTKSTHLDVLLLIATTPENIHMTENVLSKENELIQKRIEYLYPNGNNPNKKSKNDDNNNNNNDDDDNDDDGFDLGGDWGDDDDEDNEEAKAAKARQEEKEKFAKEVAAASGKQTNDMIANMKMESVDDGVLGQKWVENTLAGIGQWPPKPSTDIQDLILAQLDSNVALRRNLCMLMGRLNSQLLNTHPELKEAGAKQMIDHLYFQSSMEYRKRTIVLLEAALRIIGSTRSYKLYKTLVECYTMFKIGTTDPHSTKAIQTFQSQMEQTFGGKEGIPRIIISALDITTPDEKEIVNEDISLLEMELNRVHGESFMKQKIAMAMKQGIPPQIALQTFREGWWILLRCEKLDGDNNNDNDDDDAHNTDFIDKHPILKTLSNDTKNKYKEGRQDGRLINAWPFMVSNMKQTVGKVKVRFLAPKVPGKYRFYIDVMSQEYLGCDQSFTVEKEILDATTVQRVEKKKKKETEGGEDATEKEEDEEPKKTK